MEFDKALQGLKQTNQANAQQASAEVDKTKAELAHLRTQEVFVKSIQSLARFIEGHTTKTVVMNQLKDYATSEDMESLGKLMVDMLQELKTHENTDVSPVVSVLNEAVAELKALPKEQFEISFPEQKDYSSSFRELLTATKEVMNAIKAQKLIVEAPVVNVDAPVVQVDAPDLQPLGKDLAKSFKDAVKAIVIPVPKDYTKVLADQLTEQKKTNKLLQELPTGGSSGSSSIAPFMVDGALPITGSITASASTLADFSVNDIEESTTSYFGYTKPDGTWLIKSLTATSVSYATETNNVLVTSYTDAWTGRATLTFERFDEAF